jgi:hypothetical protein
MTYGPKPKPVATRFWSHVDKTPDCWLWTAARTPLGYGVAVAENRRITKAHRLAWELTNGPIPDDMYVCHACDNPSCVRPAHLFLGSQGANMRDARAKGRTASGRRNGSVTRPESFPWKIGREEAQAIRARYTGRRGEIMELARQYGIAHTSMSAIARGRSYRED